MVRVNKRKPPKGGFLLFTLISILGLRGGFSKILWSYYGQWKAKYHVSDCVSIAGENAYIQKRRGFSRVFLMVVGQGFEPWKAMPTDLQSVLFDRSRIPPEISRPLNHSCRKLNGARGGTRTRKDLSTCTSSMRVCQFHHPS